MARGRKVAEGVRAMVVPGSMSVKRAAEAKGLHTIFQEAGFEWRDAGCSMCVSMNEDVVSAGKPLYCDLKSQFRKQAGPTQPDTSRQSRNGGRGGHYRQNFGCA